MDVGFKGPQLGNHHLLQGLEHLQKKLCDHEMEEASVQSIWIKQPP